MDRLPSASDDTKSEGAGPGQIYTTSMWIASLAVRRTGASTDILDTGASVNLAHLNRLANRNAILASFGIDKARIVPADASFKFGDGRIGDVHKAAVFTIDIAGHIGKTTAVAVDADIPALYGDDAFEILFIARLLRTAWGWISRWT